MSYEVMWFNYLNRSNKLSLMLSDYYDKVVSTADENHIIHVARDDEKLKKIFTVFSNEVLLYEYQCSLPVEKRNMYEIIPGLKPQKIHFDVDIGEVYIKNFDEDNFINELIENIIKFIKVDLDLTKDIMIFTSHGKAKKSYHIIVNNYCLRNMHETKQFMNAIISNANGLAQYIDTSIYTTNRQFRLVGSSKLNDISRMKKFSKVWKYKGNEIVSDYQDDVTIFINSLVSNTNNCMPLDLFEKAPDRKIITNSYELSHANGEALNDVIKKMFVKKFNCGIFFKLDDQMQSGSGLLLAKRISKSFCALCDRVHENENPYFVITNRGEVKYSCRRNDGLLVSLGMLNISDSVNNDQDDSTPIIETEKGEEISESLQHILYINSIAENQREERRKENKAIFCDKAKYYANRKKVLSELISQN